MERTYDKYIVWTDSVKALTAEDKLGALQQKYDQSLQTIQEKDDKLSVKLYLFFGFFTYLEVLTAQQTLLNAQLSQVAHRFTAIQGVITLYQALGGGRM